MGAAEVAGPAEQAVELAGLAEAAGLPEQAAGFAEEISENRVPEPFAEEGTEQKVLRNFFCGGVAGPLRKKLRSGKNHLAP